MPQQGKNRKAFRVNETMATDLENVDMIVKKNPAKELNFYQVRQRLQKLFGQYAPEAKVKLIKSTDTGIAPGERKVRKRMRRWIGSWTVFIDGSHQKFETGWFSSKAKATQDLLHQVQAAIGAYEVCTLTTTYRLLLTYHLDRCTPYCNAPSYLSESQVSKGKWSIKMIARCTSC